MIRVNLLPHREEKRKRRQQQFGVLAGISVLFGLLVAGAVWLILNNVGAAAAINFGLPALVLAWMIGKALWVRFTPPEGLPLRPDEAPALTAEIEHVRRAMKAPRVQQVLVTDDYNAGVNQYARLGVLGWYRTYLLLGLPYMASMTPDEYRTKWGLPSDYPMVAPSYAQQRSGDHHQHAEPAEPRPEQHVAVPPDGLDRAEHPAHPLAQQGQGAHRCPHRGAAAGGVAVEAQDRLV